MGESPVFGAVGQVPEILAVWYARAAVDLVRLSQLTDCLPWNLNRQRKYLPSLLGRSYKGLCHHLHPYPPPHPNPHPPPPAQLRPLHLPTLNRHCPLAYQHHSQHQCSPVPPYHHPCTYSHRDHFLGQIRNRIRSTLFHHLTKLRWRLMLPRQNIPTLVSPLCLILPHVFPSATAKQRHE